VCICVHLRFHVPSFVGSAAAVLIGLLSACAIPNPQTVGPVSGAGPQVLTLNAVPFDALPGWGEDHLAPALATFAASCAKLALSPQDLALGGAGEAARLGGQAGLWGAVCTAARAAPPADDVAARAFFQTHLQAYAVGNAGNPEGLYTGYYEPQIEGARTRGGVYQTPIYSRPSDLVQVDLGAFADDLKGRTVVGRVSDGALLPYYDRNEIEAGALRSKRAELLFLADPVDAFFLQIQGSGRVTLPGGQVVRVSYAGQNGRPYVPIGRVLLTRGDIPADQVSMQSIRAWLNAHPAEASAVMNQNPSYVFFREITNIDPSVGPPGSLGVPLTPGRSIAVDRTFIPLGAPVWIDTTDPLDGSKLQRLMVAQDLGGAIRGPVRADLFFGWDAQATERAGKMRQKGQEYVLLPK
jgi:membrane-bound lytic murein transglycosylase A